MPQNALKYATQHSEWIKSIYQYFLIFRQAWQENIVYLSEIDLIPIQFFKSTPNMSGITVDGYILNPSMNVMVVCLQL